VDPISERSVHESEVKKILTKVRQDVGARRDSFSRRWKNFETIWESLSSHFWDGETRESRLLRKEASSNSDTRDNVITPLACVSAAWRGCGRSYSYRYSGKNAVGGGREEEAVETRRGSETAG